MSAQSRPPLASDACALWLGDVLRALGLERAALVGVSLGGWLALDYATRNSERVDRMVLVCTGGVGKQRIGILFKILFYSLFGAWGRRALRTAVLGRMPTDASTAARKFWRILCLAAGEHAAKDREAANLRRCSAADAHHAGVGHCRRERCAARFGGYATEDRSAGPQRRGQLSGGGRALHSGAGRCHRRVLAKRCNCWTRKGSGLGCASWCLASSREWLLLCSPSP